MEYGSNYQFNINFGKDFKLWEDLKTNRYFFASGRLAIKYIVENSEFKTVYIPNYLCEEVYNCFKKKDVKFYSINDNFEYENGLNDIENNSIVFLTNYFGLSNEATLIEIIKNAKIVEKKNIYVVYDITHSLFSTRNNDMVDCYVASIRKWFPIPDGALLSTNQKLKLKGCRISERLVKNFIYASILKLVYVRSKKKNEKINLKYRKIFQKCENDLSKIDKYKKISLFSENYLNNINKFALVQRKLNYEYLSKSIKNKYIKLFYDNYYKDRIPFILPIMCTKRDELRKYLIKNKVYCALHWEQNFMPKDIKKSISNTILSIPIDERYNLNDMENLSKIINDFGE